jgi:peptide deformylase
MLKLLTFVDKSNQILREVMPEEQNLNEPALHDTIKDMCYSILPAQLAAANGAHESAAGMAANQWGIKRRVFIFTPEGSDPGKQVEVMINPSYVPFVQSAENTPTLVGAFEGCFSVPLTTGIVNRYEAIMATYYNLSGEKIERLLEGWEARVFQHETDHLDGKLFDGILDGHLGPDCVERIIFKDTEEMNDFWAKKVRPSRIRVDNS